MTTYDRSPDARAVRPGALIAVLAVSALSLSLLQAIVSPALPSIAERLGVSTDDAAWALTAFLLSASVATPIVGRLGDIHGKRRMLIVVLAVLGLGALLAALAESLGMLVAGRVLQGVGAGVFPLAFGLIRDELPRERVPAAIGLVSAILGLGAGLGVVLSGVIVDHLSVHWLFWIPLMVVAGVLVAAVVVVPESPIRAQASINWLGALLMSTGLAGVLLAVSRTGAWGWGDPRTVGLFAVGLALIAAWIASERRARSPLVDMRMMALRGVWSVNLLGALLGFGLFSCFVLIPQYAQSSIGFGDSVTVAGLMLAPSALLMLAVGPLAGRFEARFGARIPAQLGAVFCLLGYVLLLADHGDRVAVLVASGLLGLGIGLAFAAMANLVVQAVPPEQTGVATGMNTVARTVGGAFGAQVSATLVANAAVAGAPTVAGYDHAFIVMIVALALAVLAGLAVPSRARPGGEPLAASA